MYDIRGRIYEELEKYISEGDREKLGLMLEDTENWLYEDGEDCKKQVYLDKLTELKVRLELLNIRYCEFVKTGLFQILFQFVCIHG